MNEILTLILIIILLVSLAVSLVNFVNVQYILSENLNPKCNVMLAYADNTGGTNLDVFGPSCQYLVERCYKVTNCKYLGSRDGVNTFFINAAI